jgi:hypothetical protein
MGVRERMSEEEVVKKNLNLGCRRERIGRRRALSVPLMRRALLNQT